MKHFIWISLIALSLVTNINAQIGHTENLYNVNVDSNFVVCSLNNYNSSGYIFSTKIDVAGANQRSEFVLNSSLLPLNFGSLETDVNFRIGYMIKNTFILGYGLLCNYFPDYDRKQIVLNRGGTIYGAHIKFLHSFMFNMDAWQKFSRLGLQLGIVRSNLIVENFETCLVAHINDKGVCENGIHVNTTKRDLALFIQIDLENIANRHFLLVGLGMEMSL